MLSPRCPRAKNSNTIISLVLAAAGVLGEPKALRSPRKPYVALLQTPLEQLLEHEPTLPTFHIGTCEWLRSMDICTLHKDSGESKQHQGQGFYDFGIHP